LKHGTTVRVHHGTANVAARINLLDVRHLDPGSHAIAQLRLDSPLFAFAGDHFIIRDSTEQNTLAGGIVLDADAERRGLRTAPRRAFLNARAQSPHDLAVLIQSILAREGAVKRAGLLGKSPFSTWEITEALHRAVAEKGALIHGEWAIDNDWWQAMANRAAGAIDAAHQRNPDREGLALIELRTTLEKHLPAPELFELLVAALCGNGFSQIGNSIKRATHRLALPPQLSAAGSKLRAALSAKPFDPPSRKEAAPDAASQQALRFLINSGEAIELSDEVVLLTEQFHRATGIICDHIRTRGAATASELRQTLGTSRRILIPLLERLDRDGVTRREGDKRVLNRN
jgi:selenocysteine-specific elongation factor